MTTLSKITPNLWFDKQAEEAVKFYTSIFKNSKTGRITHYTKEGFDVHKMPEGTVMTIEFEIEGQAFVALNGGPIFKFNESVSFIVDCNDQNEIDYYWNKLSEGGDPKAQVCGWLKDKYGLSWQVVPRALTDMIHDKDKQKSDRVMKAMMKMKKIIVAELEKAYQQEQYEKAE